MNREHVKVVEGCSAAVQPRQVAAIFDERGRVKLATAVGNVQVRGDMTMERAVAAVFAAADAKEPRAE